MRPPVHSALELARALALLPPRQLQVLSVALLSGRSRAEAAQHWGIPVRSADVLLWRALRELEAQLAGAPPTAPAPFGVEAAEATALAAALDAGPAEAPTPPLAGLARALRREAEAVSTELRVAEELAERSPRRAVETWARRVAVAAIIALTVFFYLRERDRTSAHFRVEPRTPIHRP